MTKPTKWHVHPGKTQISLGIHPVWSESSLSAWRKLGSLATHWVHSSYPLSAQQRRWSDWADTQADLSLRWAHMPFYWFCHEVSHFCFRCSSHFGSSSVQVSFQQGVQGLQPGAVKITRKKHALLIMEPWSLGAKIWKHAFQLHS